jgi:hypothetical protein
MKTKLLTAICALSILGTTTPVFAGEDKTLDTVVDIGLARPGCLAATIAGTAIFIVVLPIAAMSKSVKKTANTLVTTPAKATFTRPIGDFTSIED